MNSNFEAAARAAKSISGKNGTLWQSMVLFQQDYPSLDKEQMRNVIKGQEREANVEHRIKVGENSTYRVVKTVILTAIEYGISLVTAKGKPRGKTEVETDIKAARGEKSAADKFKATMATATALAGKLLLGDIPVAAGSVKELFDGLVKRLV